MTLLPFEFPTAFYWGAATSSHQVEGGCSNDWSQWSLMDNFEWDKGSWPGFGLVEIDYSTLARRLRLSAKLYAGICRINGITDGIIESYGTALQ
jgi:beta-glucosidase/6-phospho-beta-glucosidase/beta-galactosidase